VDKKFEPLHFSCTPCIVAALTDCETFRDEFSSSLQTFFRFFATFIVSELFRKNWFDATNFQIGGFSQKKITYGPVGSSYVVRLVMDDRTT